MDKRKVLETLFDPKIIKVLKLFINNPDSEYYLREVSRLTRVSPATTYRILKMMKSLELVYEERTKHLKTYYLNQKNASIFKDLLEDKTSAIQEFTEFIKQAPGVSMAVQHGLEERNKASVLVVGENIDQEAIRERVVDIKERYSFTIIYLVLDPGQYEQMLSMGLYSGRKKVLFSKSDE